MDLLEAGALGKEVNRGDASSCLATQIRKGLGGVEILLMVKGHPARKPPGMFFKPVVNKGIIGMNYQLVQDF